MRILHVVSSPSAGGAEIFVRDLSIALKKQGVEVFILFLERAEDVGRSVDFQDEFLRILDQASVGYGFIGRDARKNIFKGIIKLRRVCKEFSPHIIHVHLYYGLLFAFFAWPFKIFYTHHNIKLKVPAFLYRIFDIRVSCYIGICNACENLLRSVSVKPVVRIENGADIGRFSSLNHCGRDIDAMRFLFVGSLTKQKNVGLLLDAFALLKHKDFQLLIAGEGPDGPALISKARSLGVIDKVEFLGNIANVASLLKSVDVFVMSSLWEGLPIAQIEAAISGLPTIVTNVGGCAEIVHKVVNGLVVDSFDARDYASAISIMMEDHSLKRCFGRNAKKYSHVYGIREAVDKHVRLYEGGAV